MVWLNLDSKDEVDELYERWHEAGSKILLSRRISRGICGSSGSPIWTAISCACSMTRVVESSKDPVPQLCQIRISFSSSGVLMQRSKKSNRPEFFTSDAASRKPVIAAR